MLPTTVRMLKEPRKWTSSVNVSKPTLCLGPFLLCKKHVKGGFFGLSTYRSCEGLEVSNMGRNAAIQIVSREIPVPRGSANKGNTREKTLRRRGMEKGKAREDKKRSDVESAH